MYMYPYPFRPIDAIPMLLHEINVRKRYAAITQSHQQHERNSVIKFSIQCLAAPAGNAISPPPLPVQSSTTKQKPKQINSPSIHCIAQLTHMPNPVHSTQEKNNIHSPFPCTTIKSIKKKPNQKNAKSSILSMFCFPLFRHTLKVTATEFKFHGICFRVVR